ncbi:MAG TPA: YbhB/YbcL family Raf kinase inhibitor-like protein [Deltaproteobacteria bacterium]|nr:YbhB/YbcL family Raf kinase inhibitor-like protein [Deltaproteobacteria bacterium]
MDLKSPAFSQGGMIPAKYSCDGADISPPLSWNNVPAGTKSFALICDDPDAPVGTWVHWVYFDIPATVTSLAEHIEATEMPANGGRQGLNDFRKVGYGGPCPPSGVHRYYFKLYALDAMLNQVAGTTTKAQLLKAMEGHILTQAQLMGKYKRQ